MPFPPVICLNRLLQKSANTRALVINSSPLKNGYYSCRRRRRRRSEFVVGETRYRISIGNNVK